ncbi:MAG: signal peptidase II [Actinomycetaceae bacterium]|nr:signal peptidase II [Actinomycetaceae bacterium]
MAVERGKRAGLRVVVAVLCGITVLAVDQASKVWATTALGGGRDVPLLGSWLSFRLHYNPGAAFSFAVGATWMLTVIASIVVVVLPFFFRAAPSRMWAIALGVAWGGAAGNLADRLVRQPGFGQGHVVDFIRYGDWFIGNVADIALVVGVGTLAFLSLTDSGKGEGGQDSRGGDDDSGREGSSREEDASREESQEPGEQGEEAGLPDGDDRARPDGGNGALTVTEAQPQGEDGRADA